MSIKRGLPTSSQLLHDINFQLVMTQRGVEEGQVTIDSLARPPRSPGMP